MWMHAYVCLCMQPYIHALFSSPPISSYTLLRISFHLHLGLICSMIVPTCPYIVFYYPLFLDMINSYLYLHLISCQFYIYICLIIALRVLLPLPEATPLISIPIIIQLLTEALALYIYIFTLAAL